MARLWSARPPMPLLHDLRYAARMLRRNPGFTATAVLTLALGIGGTTAVFSVIDPLFVARLPVPSPDELVSIAVTRPDASAFFPFAPAAIALQTGVTRSEFDHLRKRSRSLVDGFLDANVADYQLDEGGGPPRVVHVGMASAGLLSTLRLVPVAGRAFVAADESPDAPPVALISHAFWTQSFGGGKEVIGRQIKLTRRERVSPATIVGVAPPGFVGTEVGVGTDIWILPPPTPANAVLTPTDPQLNFWRGGRMLARLQSGIDLEDAQAEIAAVHGQLLRDQLASFGGQMSPAQRDAFLSQRIFLSPGARGFGQLRSDFERTLVILMAAVTAVLLIACANVAALLLAQGAAQRREVAVCLAIGSGSLRLIRQQLVAGLVLAALGGAAGFLLAAWTTPALLTYAPPLAASSLDFGPNLRLLAFTAAVSLLAVALFAVVPAIRTTRSAPNISLKGSGPGVTKRHPIGRLLVPAQIAITMVLLIGASLFVRSLQNLRGADLGFDRDNVVRVQVNGAFDHTPVLLRLEQLPGVQSATVWSTGLMSGPGMSMSGPVIVDGRTGSRNEFVTSAGVGPRFFQTMGIQLIRGRDFVPDDALPKRNTVIVSAAMATHFFGTLDAVGRHLRLNPSANAQVFEVVGVAENAKYSTLREESAQTIYYPSVPGAKSPKQLAVRVPGDMTTAAAAIGDALRRFDPQMQITSIRSVDDIVEEAILRERFLAHVSTGLGLLGLFLACLGLYGTLAYAVTQRTNEIGIRMALGARSQTIAGMLLRETGLSVGVGMFVGLTGAFAAARVTGSLLFGLTPQDPVALASAVVILIAAATVAAALPARRAARIDPIVALKYE